MVRIVIGVIIFVIGFFTWLEAESSADGGIIWTGGMIFGGILVLTGLRRLITQR